MICAAQLLHNKAFGVVKKTLAQESVHNTSKQKCALLHLLGLLSIVTAEKCCQCMGCISRLDQI